MGLARDAEADAGGQALPLFRRPRPDDAGRDRDQQCSRRDRRGACARRAPTSASAARPSAAPCTTARSWACRCETPATSTATASRWSRCGWWGREAAASLVPLNNLTGTHRALLSAATRSSHQSPNGVHPHVRIRLGRADRHAIERRQLRPRSTSGWSRRSASTRRSASRNSTANMRSRSPSDPARARSRARRPWRASAAKPSVACSIIRSRPWARRSLSSPRCIASPRRAPTRSPSRTRRTSWPTRALFMPRAACR